MSGRWGWATVTQVSPLRVRMDGESTALPVTPTDLTGGVAVGDRVRVHFDGQAVLATASVGGVPAGALQPFAGATAPSGWLVCDGAAISRTTYARLFAAIGTTYGVGDGSTTFNVPNVKGRTIVGRDSGQTEFDSLGETGGAKTHTLTESEMPSHSHTLSTDYAGGTVDGSSGSGYLKVSAGNLGRTTSPTTARTLSVISSTGGGGAHNNLPPYLVANYLIKT